MSGTGDRIHKSKSNDGAAARTDILCNEASAENLFRALSKSSSDAIIGEDLQRRINVWNDTAQALFGFTGQEMLGNDLLCIMPPDDAKLEISIVRQILLGNSISSMKTVRLHKDGRRRDISLTVAPVRNPGGRVVGALKTLNWKFSKRAHCTTPGRSRRRCAPAGPLVCISRWTISACVIPR